MGGVRSLQQGLRSCYGNDVAKITSKQQVTVITDVATRLKLFDQATERQRLRQVRRRARRAPAGRRWTREQLYERGRAR
jgi:F0F1-type ATP synthase epsilon subunit